MFFLPLKGVAKILQFIKSSFYDYLGNAGGEKWSA
jgi:hypothetical protein